MVLTIGYDSTLFTRGTLSPFSVPLGIGVIPRDPAKSEQTLRKGFAALATRFPQLKTRPFWSSVHLLRKCPQAQSLELLKPLVQGVLSTVDVLHVAYSVTRLEEVKIHGLTEPKVVARDSFMSSLQQGYVYHCLWKFGQTHDMTQYHAFLDGMNPVETGGSARVSSYSYEVFSHGDEVNPLICSADLIAKYIDLALETMPDPAGRYRSAPLNEASLERLLTGTGVNLVAQVIGTKDFHYVTPLRSGGGRTALPYRHPIIFVVREPPPPEIGAVPNKALEAFDEPLVDQAVNRAVSVNGCWKRWDNSDIQSLDQDKDQIIYCGPTGAKLVEWIKTLRPRIQVEKWTDVSPSGAGEG